MSPRTAPGDLKVEQGGPVTSPGEVMCGDLCRANSMGGRKYHLVYLGGGHAQGDENSGAKHAGKE